MANKFGSNPWLIDTPSALPEAPNGLVFDNRIEHAQMEFIMYTAATDACEIQDRNGKLVAFLQGAADLRTVRTGRIGWVEGLRVPVTMSNGLPNVASGKILIYYE